MSQERLENLLKVTDVINPPASLVAQANLQDYEGEYRRSIEDPEGFWGQIAAELHWFRPWSQGFQWE